MPYAARRHRRGVEDAEVVYVLVDIQVVDPGLAPGTGAPEPGGLTSRESLRAVHELCGATHLAGMDIVEVAPPTAPPK